VVGVFLVDLGRLSRLAFLVLEILYFVCSSKASHVAGPKCIELHLQHATKHLRATVKDGGVSMVVNKLKRTQTLKTINIPAKLSVVFRQVDW
jgi:hypothetical protein